MTSRAITESEARIIVQEMIAKEELVIEKDLEAYLEKLVFEKWQASNEPYINAVKWVIRFALILVATGILAIVFPYAKGLTP